jgi:serine/threonine-protein kinase
MTPEDRFRLLARVALVDQHLDAGEKEMLVRCAAWLGLTRERAGQILSQVMRDPSGGELNLPSDPAQRDGLFNGVINVIVADGQVTVREQACLLKLAPAFGVDPRAVEARVRQAMTRSVSSRDWPTGWQQSPQRHTTGLSPRPQPAPKPAPNLELGTLVGGRFRLDALLGAGGFGKVFRARHMDLDEDVALKVLLPHVAGSEDARQRFLREVKVCRSFSHRYSMTLREFGRDQPTGCLYFTMDLVAGKTLGDLLDQGPLSVERAIPLFGQVLECLSEAHRVGLVHRDLKPGNLMLTQGPDGREEVRVLDFGIARAVEEAGESGVGQLTMAGGVVGTPAYMSPEQAGGADVDPRSDLYSLAVVLFQALTGKLPYQPKPGAKGRQQSVLFHIIMEPPTRLEDVDPGLPKALGDVLYKCMEKEAPDRYPDALALRDALAASVRGQAAKGGLLSRWLDALTGD